MSKKRLTLAVTVSVPKWMTKAHAAREVRTLINDQCGYLSAGPNGEPFDYPDFRAVAVKPAKKEG